MAKEAKERKNVFIETAQMLQKYAEQNDSIVVAFSGGKDSYCVLDLCSRVFTNIVCYTMYLVPDLRTFKEHVELARKRYPNVTFAEYPHWLLFNLLSQGIYTPQYYKTWSMPEVGPFEIKSLVMQDTGIYLVADGSKASDGMARRRTLSTSRKAWEGKVIYPIEHWNKWDVLSYLKIHEIPLPLSSGGATTGVDMAARSLMWLHDVYPDDFAKLEKVFPHCRAAVYRREWYGLGSPRYSPEGKTLEEMEPLPVGEDPYSTRLSSYKEYLPHAKKEADEQRSGSDGAAGTDSPAAL